MDLGSLLRSSTENENPLDADSRGGVNSSPTFVTAQALVSFPVASGVVTGLWKTLQAIFGSWADRNWIALAMAVALGVFIAWYATEEGAWAGLSAHKRRRAQAAAFVIGAINTAFLAAAAIGVDSTL